MVINAPAVTGKMSNSRKPVIYVLGFNANLTL